MLATLLTLALTARGAPLHPHALPEHREDPANLAAWTADASGAWRVSAPQWAPATRVAGARTLATAGMDVPIEARGVARDGSRGAWTPMVVTHVEGADAVVVADLDGRWDGVELRVPASAMPLLDALAWEPLVPTYPHAGALARAAAQAGPTRTPVLRSELAAIGVVSRETWGARPTTCTTREDDWYRVAVHHTAGNPTYGGTVEGAVRFLQAYAQDGGTYCDIPYQFLVGVDGSLWEGRPQDMQSGATYENNDGNAAVSFMGCFTPSGCPGSTTDVTEAMITSGQLLVQTLADIEAIEMSNVRGHKDWSGWDHTSCPGDWLYARLDDLRSPLETWGGRVIGSGFASDGPVRIALGETASGWWDVQNTGTTTWTPGQTKLATLPRDEASPLADAGWLSPTRPSTVEANVAPGVVARFPLVLRGNEEGTFDVAFGLVEEWVTWFADDAGPAEDAMTLRVVVTADPGDTGDAADGDTALGGAVPGALSPVAGMEGCGCAGLGAGEVPRNAPLSLGAGLLAVALARTRRRD
jgi:hypothetical protein